MKRTLVLIATLAIAMACEDPAPSRVDAGGDGQTTSAPAEGGTEGLEPAPANTGGATGSSTTATGGRGSLPEPPMDSGSETTADLPNAGGVPAEDPRALDAGDSGSLAGGRPSGGALVDASVQPRDASVVALADAGTPGGGSLDAFSTPSVPHDAGVDGSSPERDYLAEATTHCEAICSHHQVLGCEEGTNPCAAVCRSIFMDLGVRCPSEYVDWLACLATLPASDFECGPCCSRVDAKDGTCPEEFAVYAECDPYSAAVATSAQIRPPPDQGIE